MIDIQVGWIIICACDSARFIKMTDKRNVHARVNTVLPGALPLRNCVTAKVGYLCSKSRGWGVIVGDIERGRCCKKMCPIRVNRDVKFFAWLNGKKIQNAFEIQMPMQMSRHCILNVSLLLFMLHFSCSIYCFFSRSLFSPTDFCVPDKQKHRSKHCNELRDQYVTR